MPIPVIDLFAGPGGLGEGFSSYTNGSSTPFQIALSIEKDTAAHKTLKTRALLRQFKNEIPEEYYDFLRSDRSGFSEYLDSRLFKDQIRNAELEAQNLELGPDNKIIANLIRERLKRKPFVLIGGPPCQVYSTDGRSRMKGIEGFENDERHFLYKLYLNVIAEFEPEVFVFENVKGILSSKYEGQKIFKVLKEDPSNPGSAVNEGSGNRLRYNIYSFTCSEDPFLPGLAELSPSDFVIKSENYGIPQKRHRVILLGIRDDLGVKHDQNYILNESPPFSTEDAIKDLPNLRSRISTGSDNFENWKLVLRKLPEMIQNFLPELNNELHNVISQLEGRKYEPNSGGRFIAKKISKDRGSGEFVKKNWEWFHDERIGGVVNSETKSHQALDLWIYLWCSTYAKVYLRSPKLYDFPEIILPKHKGVIDAYKNGKKIPRSDKFRVQLRKEPSNTITSHLFRDGHQFIHYDPLQCRSLTPREAARIQTFPDNYFFEGSRTKQYEQIGNAVPPLLARQLANTVFQIMKDL